jgi:periplasmic protein CpxP/Spy
MKNQKLLALVFGVAVLFAGAAQAQEKGKRGKEGGDGQGRGQMMSPDERVAQLDKALSLTEDQKTKIKAIYAKAQEDMRAAMRGGGGGDREAARAKMMDAMKKTREDVRAVLTDEQKTKFDALPQRGGGDQGGRRGKRGENK